MTRRIALWVILMAWGWPLHAALIEKDWEQAALGNGQITLDSVSGLEWLDVTVTGNKSKEDVLALLAAGGQYEGFRYATIAEWQGLVTAAGIPLNLIGGSYFASLYEPVAALMDLIGATYVVGGDNNATHGMLADQYGLCCARETYLEIRHDMGDVARVIDNFARPVWERHEQIGSYLIRDAKQVPEPNTIALLSLGLAGLAFTRRRKQ